MIDKLSGLIAFIMTLSVLCLPAAALKPLNKPIYKPQPFKGMQSAPARASDAGLKIDGEVFFSFQKYLTQASAVSYNKFDITRAYINFKKALSEGANVRVTLDAARLAAATDPTGSSQYLLDFLKYAYVELPLADNPNISLSTKLGLQQTVWAPFAEKLWGNRYIAKVFTDDEGIISTADFGIGFQGTLKALGAEYALTLMNGSGFKNPETNSGKDIALRLNKDIFSGANGGSVVLGAYTVMTDRFGAGSDSAIYGAMLGYKSEPGSSLYAEYLGGKRSAADISGYSVGGYFFLLPEVYILGRYDYYNPDISTSASVVQKTFAGLSYVWTKEVRVALDLQSMQTGQSAPQRVAYLHSEIKY